ncbi:MAG: hypothetical protein IKE65_00155 [Clostridia bacterium]|nr:hypothetical protein [Clostridia bacterium]
MGNDYRLNLRFRLNCPKERKAAEYLKTLQGQSRNQFICDAILSYMEQQSGKTISISDIRTVLQEELKAVSFVSVGVKPDTSDEEEAAQNNIQNLLEDLEMFD